MARDSDLYADDMCYQWRTTGASHDFDWAPHFGVVPQQVGLRCLRLLWLLVSFSAKWSVVIGFGEMTEMTCRIRQNCIRQNCCFKHLQTQGPSL